MTKSATKSAMSLVVFGTMLTLLAGTPAQATNTKSYVSNTGSDANDCSSVALACASLQHAHDQTSRGGEVSIVNTGDYSGPGIGAGARVSITKSLHITNDGAGEASVKSSTTTALLIEPPPGDIVSVRGLVIDGQGGGRHGILTSSSSTAIHIQHCVIRNFQDPGAFAIQAITDNMQIFVSDSIIFNNGSNATSGGMVVFAKTLSGNSDSKIVLDRVHLENNVIGVLVDGRTSIGHAAHVIMRDSMVSGNVSDGIRAITMAGNAPAFLFVERTTVVNNAGTGILANGPGATLLLSDNTISRNGAGISAINSGQLISFGNNRNANNVGPEGAPTGFYSQM